MFRKITANSINYKYELFYVLLHRNNLQISKGEFNRASDKGLWVTKQKRTLDIWGMAGLFDGGTNHLALTHLKIHEKFFGPGYFLSNLIIWEVKLLLVSK